MSKLHLPGGAPTMIVPSGTEIGVDGRGQLSIRTPGNLVLQTSGQYGALESLAGSIRIGVDAAVEAVTVRCPETCYIEGSLTAWKVSAEAIYVEDQAEANIVLQESGRLEVGRGARVVGNFGSEKELFVLLSRFADQLRSLPFFGERRPAAAALEGAPELPAPPPATGEAPRAPAPETSREGGGEGPAHPDALFFALVLLEREQARGRHPPGGQRILNELVKLLQAGDLEALRLTYRTLFGRLPEPGGDVRRARELVAGHFTGG